MQANLDFAIINAFSDDSFGGNPAAIVFVEEPLPDHLLDKININLNQPITAYVSQPQAATPEKPDVATFSLRWFGPRNGEVKICGHGTLAAAEAVFRRLDPAKNIRTLEFHTKSGVLTANRVDDGKISMDLPAGTTIPATPVEIEAVHSAFCRALSKPCVALRYVAHGGPGFENYLFVEVDISEDLASWRPDVQPLLEFAPRTHIIVVTSASRDPAIAYETRMFGPALGVPEDHVCGSAHCLNAPYWASKRTSVRPVGAEQHAKAVSVRGGDVWATYFRDAGVVRVRGQVKLTASGVLDLADAIVN